MRIRFVCPHCKVARTWASSRVLAGHYLASQKQVAMLMYCTTCQHLVIILLALHACRLIHAFTCADMLPSQFMNFCKFAEIGVVSCKYIHSGRYR